MASVIAQRYALVLSMSIAVTISLPTQGQTDGDTEAARIQRQLEKMRAELRNARGSEPGGRATLEVRAATLRRVFHTEPERAPPPAGACARGDAVCLADRIMEEQRALALRMSFLCVVLEDLLDEQ
jgi:hypothetical protein